MGRPSKAYSTVLVGQDTHSFIVSTMIAEHQMLDDDKPIIIVLSSTFMNQAIAWKFWHKKEYCSQCQ